MGHSDENAPTLADLMARHEAAVEAWSWHEQTDDTLAGYGHHMSQMLHRLPVDSQTADMKTSIDAMLADLGAALFRLSVIQDFAEQLRVYGSRPHGGLTPDLDAAADAVRRVVAGFLLGVTERGVGLDGLPAGGDSDG